VKKLRIFCYQWRRANVIFSWLEIMSFFVAVMQMQQEKFDFFPLNRALSLSAMDEDSTESKVDDLLRQVHMLVERQKEEVRDWETYTPMGVGWVFIQYNARNATGAVKVPNAGTQRKNRYRFCHCVLAIASAASVVFVAYFLAIIAERTYYRCISSATSVVFVAYVLFLRELHQKTTQRLCVACVALDRN